MAFLVVLQQALVDPEPLEASLAVLQQALVDPEPLEASLAVLQQALVDPEPLVEPDEERTFRLAVLMLASVALLGLAQVRE